MRRKRRVDSFYIPKNGIHGGLALCKVSRYSAKFFVLSISFLIESSTVDVRALTWFQVLFRRCMGAVPSAEMIDVNVEKLFN